MSDFTELSKQVEAFLKEVKKFTSEITGTDDAEDKQERYVEIRSKKKEYIKEVEECEPAKKPFRFDSKKSSLIKSLKSELTKVEKAMTKHGIEIPEDEDEEEEETSPADKDSKSKKKKAGEDKEDGKGKSKKEKSSKKKSGKEGKKGSNKVEVIEDDRKSASSAKDKQSEQPDEEADNDFSDTEEEDEQTAPAGGGEVAEDRVSTTSKDAKEKKKDKVGTEASKKDGKKARKDSEKSATSGKESKKDQGKEKEDKKSKKKDSGKKKGKGKKDEEEEENEEVEEGEKEKKKSGKSKDGKKSKTKEKTGKKGKAKKGKKGTKDDEEEEEEEAEKEDADKDTEQKEEARNKKAAGGEEPAKEAEVVHSESAKGRTATAAAAAAAAPGWSAVVEDEESEEEEESYGEDEDFEEVTEPASEPATSVVARTAAPTRAAPTPAPRQQVQAQPQQEKQPEQKRPPQQQQQAPAAPVQLEDDEEFDEEDEEDEEDEIYENMRTLAPNEPNTYEVLQSHTELQDPDMMSIQKGEIIRVLKVGPDGWWLARNGRGNEGLVPSTLLHLVTEDESDEGSELDDVTQADTTTAAAEGRDDQSRTGPTEGDYESEEEADDFTASYEAQDAEVVSTDRSFSQRAANDSPPMPGVPSGFRVSTLAGWFFEGTKRWPGRQFTLQNLLQPKLTASCMSLQDGWGCTPQVRPVPSRVEKLVHLQKCQVMPTGLPVKPLDRFVRLCLFDAHGPVSNVHTVRATVAKDDKLWSFGTRATDAGTTLEYGEAFLRYNCACNHVKLLLEACVVCKNEAAGAGPDTIEMSVGHVTVPLFDDNGGPLPAKGYDLLLEGGNPFEQNKEVDATLGKSSTQKSFSGAKSQPRIQLKLSVPNKETKEFMDTCPSTMVGNLSHLQLHSLYRHALASELIGSNRLLEQRSSPIFAPHLVQFPAMADQPDLMDVIRKRWNEFAKRDRAFRKPHVSEAMKQEFIRIVKSTYFLNQLKDFQPYEFGNKTQEQLRANLILDFQRKIATDQTAVNFSISADAVVEPFSMEEVALPMIGQFAAPVLPVAVD